MFEEIRNLFKDKDRDEEEIKISMCHEKDADGKEWVVVSVQDSGAGWHWDDMPRDARERYQNIRSSTEKMNGKFEYANIKGQGAVVKVRFPASYDENEKLESTVSSQFFQGGVIMKKVLIVDDELEFVKDFSKALVMFGHEPFQAVDGEGAFEVIETKKPDIVLCDYKLPDMEGDRILEMTKKNHPEIKFVMLTAYYDEVVKERFKRLGADEVIFKPIVLTEIEALLAKL
ncbi:MAG: response regulator [Candidatus Omnitrophica bacterium]|nr:response regulator [Candidatus Omnitrophota bacterium]